MSILKSSALVAITAILVVWLPTFFREQPPVVVNGFVAEGFQEVKVAFRQNFESGADSRSGGSAFSVYHRGEKVVDLWGGYADLESRQEWKEDTISIFYSVTKGIASMCLALLVDRGQLDYDHTVSHYWPEFAQKGKAKITVRQLLQHQAGLVLAAPPGLSFDLLRDVAKAGELMASTEPLWEVDGKTHGYHTITYGPLVNELLRRADPKHRTMGQFFAEEIAQPFGVDFYIGLPLTENYRAARLAPSSTSALAALLAGISSPTNRKMMWHFMRNDLYQRSLDNAGFGEGSPFNNPYVRSLEIASASGFGSARSVAKLYGILASGGKDTETNRTLLSRKIIDQLFIANPPSPDETLGFDLAFNLGMMSVDLWEGEMLFGHFGVGGQLGFADPAHQLGFGFVSSTMSPYFMRDDPRPQELLAALYRCVRRIEQGTS